MPLDKQVVNVPLLGGVDERTKSELVDGTTSFLQLRNVRRNHRGAYDKRNGFAALTRNRVVGARRNKALKIFALAETLCAIDGHNVDAYSESAAESVTRDQVAECTVTRTDVPNYGQTAFLYDVGYANGYYVIATFSVTNTATPITACVIDTNGAIVVTPTTLIANAALVSSLRVTNVGNVVQIIYCDTTTTISMRTIDLSTPATIAAGFTAQAALANDFQVGTGPFFAFDACNVDDSQFALAYPRTSASTSKMRLRTYGATGTAAQSTFLTTSAYSTPAIAALAADTLWIAYYNGGSGNEEIQGRSVAAIGTTLASAGTIASGVQAGYGGIVATSPGACVVSLFISSGFLTTWQNVTTAAGVAVPGANSGFQPYLRLCTRPFMQDGRVYISVAPTDSTGSLLPLQNHFVVDVTAASVTMRPVANIAPGVASPLGLQATSPVSATATTVQFLQLVKRAAAGVFTGAYSTELVSLDFANTNRWQAAQLAQVACLSGGVASYFDGNRVSEIGFLAQPQILTTSVGGTGITGTFNYTFVWEQVDAQGNVHQSAPANPVSQTAANQTVTIVVQPLGVTSRQDAGNNLGPPQAVLYRTQTNGQIYYRVGTQQQLPNDPSSVSMTFTDAVTDTAIAANQQLYTQPGVPGASLYRKAFPSLSCLIVHGDRLVGATGNVVWFSAERVDGEGLWTHDVFQFPVEKGGDITALGSQDGRLYVFKRSTIFVVDGDGPPENGGNGTEFSTPAQLPADSGCIEPRSVVNCEGGIMFQSDRGLELLDRSGRVQWIGEAVQDSLASCPIVTGAVLDETSRTVRFACVQADDGTGATGNGVVLVYDYADNVWITDDLHDASGNPSAPASSACAVPVNGGVPVFHWATRDGTVLREVEGSALDPSSSWITFEVETGWFKTSGIQGFQRVWRVLTIGEYVGAHNLLVDLAFDYSASYTQPSTWTDAELSAMPREQIALHVASQKCEAIRIRVKDATPGGSPSGQSLSLFGLALEVGAKRGAFKLPATQKG